MKLIVAAMVVSMIACSHRDGIFQQIAGRRFDHTHVQNIIDGRTTEKELIDWFGQPLETRDVGTNKVWTYFSRRQRESTERLLFFKRTYVQTWDQHLTLTLNRGVVQHHDYKSNTVER